MEPIPEAVAWALRADAWSQRPGEPAGTLESTTNRWSEVAPTGRPAFPPDGVGWRSATSEWRSTSESRWRQTTEWRSSTGNSGWRSTTEAWQTGGNADELRPPTEPLTRMPAISGTAWPTPVTDDQPWASTPGLAPGRPQPEPQPPWQAPVDQPPPWQRTEPATPADTTPSWQSRAEPAAPWQTPADTTSSWQSPVESAPSWQQPAEPPPWQSPADATPSWRQTGETTSSWQSPADPSPARRQPGEEPPTWRRDSTDTPSWQQPADPAPSWQATAGPAPSWQTSADPAPSWQKSAEPAPSWQQPGDATPSWRQTSGTSSWQQNGDAPSWQQSPGTTPSWQGSTETPSWQQPDGTSSWRGGETPSWRQGGETPSWRKGADTPSWRTGGGTAGTGGGSARTDAGSAPSWQAPADSTPSWQRAAEAPRRPAATGEPWRSGATPTSSSWQTSAAPAPSWQSADDTPSWRADDGRPARGTRDVPAAPTSTDRGRDANGRAWPVEPASGPYGGAWPGPSAYDDGRHLVREDDRAQWRREAAAGLRGADGRTGRVGRRRAPEPDGERPGGGTGWAAKGDTDDRAGQDWAGHTDTGIIPAFRDDDTGREATWRDGRTPASGAWRDRASADETRRIPYDSGTVSRNGRSRREGSDEDSRADDRPANDRPADERDAGDEPGTSGRRRTEARRDGATGSRRRFVDLPPGADPWARDAADTGVGPLAWQAPEDTGTGGWQSPSDTATWRRYIDDPEDAAGTVRPRSSAASWQSSPERPSRRRVEPETDAEIDPDDEPRRRADPDDRPRRGGPGESRGRIGPDDGPRRRARTGPDRDDASPDDRDDEPPAPPPWRPGAQDDDRTESWRRELQADLRREGAGPGRSDVTEIRPAPEPGAWRLEQGDQPARGTASYREGSSDDWRQELAAQNGTGGTGSRAAGPSDFPKFRPPGGGASGSAPVAAAPARGSAAAGPARGSAAPARGSAAVESVEARPREELLVGTRSGGRSWQEPPDTQWPPRRAVEAGSAQRESAAVAGPYERRPVSTLPETSSRQRSLLEPDEDLEDDPGGPLAAVGFTAAWYSVPVVLFMVYMLVLDGAQQSQAFATLAGAAPRFGVSLVLSMVVAVGLRWASGTWKAASVGLAAAVMGGGLATVLNSAITGQSLS